MQIPITNNKEHVIYVGGMSLEPGETRVVDEHRVPKHLRPSAPEKKAEPKQDPVLAILDHKVADVVEKLPSLSDEDLAKVKAAEDAGNTRTTLMKAIAEEELKRANAKADAEAKAKEEAEAKAKAEAGGGEGGDNPDGGEGSEGGSGDAETAPEE